MRALWNSIEMWRVWGCVCVRETIAYIRVRQILKNIYHDFKKKSMWWVGGGVPQMAYLYFSILGSDLWPDANHILYQGYCFCPRNPREIEVKISDSPFSSENYRILTDPRESNFYPPCIYQGLCLHVHQSFPGGSAGEESTCYAGDLGLLPG